MRGRKPKPSALKELEGNPGKRAVNKKEPKPDVAIPSCPNHLTGVAKQEWNRVTKELAKLGLITNVDRAALAAYCTAYKDYVRAENELKEGGQVIFTEKGGAYQNPWVGIKNSAIEKMIKIGVEFELTPSSRVRLQVEKPNEENEMAGFLFGNTSVKVKTKQ
jgi:P27 family predicted phage terminase small subunit